MTTIELPTPAAVRLQRPRWRDPRLVVGVLLVFASVVLGSLVVGRGDVRSPFYAARTTLVPGQRLTEADLTPVEVRLGSAGARYVEADRALEPDRFVLREVRAGELVPEASVGGRGEVAVQPVTVPVEAGTAATLVAGSRVDVYVNPPRGGQSAGQPGGPSGASPGAYAGPQLTLRAVSVARIPRQGGALGGGSSQQPVQIMAPVGSIRELIATVDNGSRITLVPVPGTVLESPQ
jgi:hypothetical protein